MYNILKKETVFSTDWFYIEAKTLEGEKLPYYSLELQDYVIILALTKKNEVLLVKQYRPVLEEETLELPSGHVEKGQTAEEAARAELLEETGYIAQHIELLGILNPDPGRLSNKLWCFFAENVSKSKNSPEERIEVIKCEKDYLKKIIVEGKLNHAMNLAVLYFARQKNIPFFQTL